MAPGQLVLVFAAKRRHVNRRTSLRPIDALNETSSATIGMHARICRDVPWDEPNGVDS